MRFRETLQGALLVEALYQVAAESGHRSGKFTPWGENVWARPGQSCWGTLPALGSVGVFEAIPYILPTLQLQKRVRADLLKYPPDLAVLIDYMTPNLKIGRDLRRFFSRGAGGLLHCSPSSGYGAFSQKDTKQIVGNSDRMLAIFSG